MSVGKTEEGDALIAEKGIAVENAVARGAAADNLKAAAGEICNSAKARLRLVGYGSDAKAFMRGTLAELVRPGMKVYADLRRDIFD